MLTRVAKARTGKTNMKADLSLPLIKGTKRAPTINIAAGGIKLFIVVLVSLEKYAQQFCYENEEHTGDKSIHCKKFRGILPWELSMLVDKEVNDKEHHEGCIKKTQESFYIFRFVKNFQLFFHLKPLLLFGYRKGLRKMKPRYRTDTSSTI